jgi:hypothetical protein
MNKFYNNKVFISSNYLVHPNIMRFTERHQKTAVFRTHNAEVGGSSPPIATNKNNELIVSAPKRWVLKNVAIHRAPSPSSVSVAVTPPLPLQTHPR